MFKSKYIIGIALAILTGFNSCADLDLPPLGSPEAGEISEERQAFLRLAAVYSGMKDFRYTWSMQCFGDVLSEDATYSGSSNDEASFTLMENYQYPADHTEILNKYTYSYMCINKANLFIQDMESADDALFSQYNKEQMIGEAKFIRAYTYFELVKIFGGVPCYTEVLALDHERLGRSSVEEVYAVIEQDLNDAVAVLPKKSEIANYETEYAGRITKGAALAMQTRVYLYEKKYDEVKKAFENFQNECGSEYSLVSPDEYAWQFSLDGEHCSASILEINMYNSTTQSSYGSNNGNRHVLMSMPRNMTNGFGCAQPTQALADAYDAEGDMIRKNTTLLSKEEAVQILYLAPGQREENRGNNQPTNLRLIRLAEVYLNYAEACYFTGDISNAQKYLNEVRSHVNLAPKNNTGEKLFEDIMNERHLEFGMEGFRFFDVVRVGWGEKVFSNIVKYGAYKMNPFHAGAEVLPIPQSEIDISGGLITN